MLKTIRIRTFEKGLLFKQGEFVGLLGAGRHWFFDPLSRVKVEVVALRAPWLIHDKLDLIVKSGILGAQALVLDLKDHERALVWIDGRFAQILPPGLHVAWTTHRQVRAEVVDAREPRFSHPELPAILQAPGVGLLLDTVLVSADQQGIYTVDGEYRATLPPGRHAFWRNRGQVKVQPVDRRETVLDVSGQEIMTADKVTLRLNAVAVYRIVDARQSLTVADDARQALYRETQLALRALVGAKELDALLAEKDTLVQELAAAVRPRAQALGTELLTVGIRDVILPGEMKELLNRVTEAKKAAEANLIARREETAAMRSQANTARLLQDNPTLMRLRELEVLEKIAAQAKLNVILGEKGLAEKVINLL